MANSGRGFASMSVEDRKAAARRGGLESSGSFVKGSKRASDAGKKGAANQSIKDKQRGGENSHRNS